MNFTLWLEFELEHWQNEPYDPEDEFFNMTVTLASGKRYALNVWTFKLHEAAVRAIRFEDAAERERFRSFGLVAGHSIEREYMLPPDLLVSRLDRKLIEQMVAHMLEQWNGELLPQWECGPPLDEDVEEGDDEAVS